MLDNDVLLLYDKSMLDHNPTGWDPGRPEWTAAVKQLLAAQYPDKNLDDYAHPERPQRLTVIVDKLVAEPVPGTRWMQAKAAELDELCRVHTPAHVDHIEGLLGRSGWLSVDTTAVSPGSVAAAKLAAGAGVTAVDAIMRGDATRAFCVIRPPGHHALANGAMGFCLYNNVAVTAAHARARGLHRVLIFDWDLHHGNGTQDIFFADPNVLFIDTHCASPFYPGTGAIDEIGTGEGTGRTLNVPLHPGSGNAALLAALEQIVRPAAAAFKPDLVLVSAGFDAHYLDQTFTMDQSGFAALTAGMCEIANTHCDGRLIMCLEGGYNGEALATSARAVVTVLTGDSPVSWNSLPDDPGTVAVGEIASLHAATLHNL